MACTGKRWLPGASVSGETTVVNCQACRQTAAFKRAEREQHPPDATEKGRSRVDERVSKIDIDSHPDLDADLAGALSAVATGVRECHRLIGSIPHLWSDEGEYRRLAACVADAATAACSAYQVVDMRLRRAGGPNPMREALKAVEAVRDLAPLDPNGTPGGLNATLTKLYTRWALLYPQADGSECIDRILDQLARVPPARKSGAGEAKTEDITKSLKEFLAGELAQLSNIVARPVDAPPGTLTEKQREILKALDAKAMTLDELATQLDCDKSRLHRDHLKPLKKLGRVINDRKVGGYYRPDAPPTMA